MRSARSDDPNGRPDRPEGMQTLAALPFPIMIIGADLYIRYINPAAEHFFGHSAPQLVKSKLDIVALPDSPLIAQSGEPPLR